MGSGHTLDTAVLKGLERDYFLAGGLSPDNVRAAVEELSPYGVDASSGLETDGFKDYEKMKRFMQEVRSKETDDRGHMLQV
jgi:phosphoribosylanthranilate isomerase